MFGEGLPGHRFFYLTKGGCELSLWPLGPKQYSDYFGDSFKKKRGGGTWAETDQWPGFFWKGEELMCWKVLLWSEVVLIFKHFIDLSGPVLWSVVGGPADLASLKSLSETIKLRSEKHWLIYLLPLKVMTLRFPSPGEVIRPCSLSGYLLCLCPSRWTR